jgi:hypothetical protein
VSFVAVGPDFTQPDRLFAAWRADPANAELSLVIDLVVSSLPSLTSHIETGVAQRALALRTGQGTSKRRFWKEVSRLIARYNPQAYGERTISEHQGRPELIDADRLASTIKATRNQLRQMTDQAWLPG